VLLTNGLLDTRDASGASFGYRRFHKLLKAQQSANPEALRDAVLQAIATHGKSRPGQGVADDQALLVLSCS